MKDIDKKLKFILKESGIKESELQDLDSLDFIDLMIEIEEEFGINFDDKDLIDIKTYSELKALIERKLKYENK